MATGAILIASALSTAVTSTVAAVGTGIMAGLGAVGIGAGTTAGLTGWSLGVATVTSAATTGAIYGAATGGLMAAATGGNIVDGMKGGAMSGAMTGGAAGIGGIAGNFAGSMMNYGTVGQTAVTGTVGGIAAYGGAKAMGMSDQQALTTGLTTGALAGLNRYQNMTQPVEYGSTLTDVEMAQLGPDANPADYIDYSSGGGTPISFHETATTGVGRMIASLASGAAAVTPVEVDLTNPMISEGGYDIQKNTQKGTIESIGGKGSQVGGIVESAESGGAAWKRTSGQLKGGTEQLGSTLPEAKKKSKAGTADQMLFEENLVPA